MANKIYKVLWIDDMPTDELRDEAALIYGIDLIPKKCYSEGIAWLSENITTCDAVILDVYCKDNNDETPNIESFRDNIDKVRSLCTQNSRFIPWFVYTGGPSGTQQGYEFIDFLVKAVPRKWDNRPFYNKPADRLELFQKIIDEAGKREITRIKLKYPSAFLIDDSIHGDLINILSSLESDNGCDRDFDVLRDVAVVMEKIREYLVSAGFLPSELVSGIQISKCASFLGRREMQSIIPGYIQQNIYTCINTGSEGGHALPAREDVEKGKAPFLVRSITFAMLSLLHWLSEQKMDKDSIASRTKKTMEVFNSMSENQAPESQSENNALIQKFEGNAFIVEVDDEGIVHCGECATHNNAKSLAGKQVKLSKVNTNTSPSGKKYPVFAGRYSEINQ